MTINYFCVDIKEKMWIVVLTLWGIGARTLQLLAGKTKIRQIGDSDFISLFPFWFILSLICLVVFLQSCPVLLTQHTDPVLNTFHRINTFVTVSDHSSQQMATKLHERRDTASSSSSSSGASAGRTDDLHDYKLLKLFFSERWRNIRDGVILSRLVRCCSFWISSCLISPVNRMWN